MALAPCSESCVCVPYTNRCCCIATEAGLYRGITVTQPTCQTIPDGEYSLGDPITMTKVAPNPCSTNGISFWTYKFLTDCRPGAGGEGTNAISHINIPVCKDLKEEDIAVYEKIDGCGNFTLLGSDIVSLEDRDNSCDPDVFPPDGFQFLKISNDPARFEKGVCVTYLIAIGQPVSPAEGKTIVVKSNVCLFAGGEGGQCDDGEDCFVVPGCEERADITVKKACAVNEKFITYTVTLSGDPATVTVEDTLTIPNGVNLVINDLPDDCTALYNGNPVVEGDTLVGPGTLVITCTGVTVPSVLTFVFEVTEAPVSTPVLINNTVSNVTTENGPINVTFDPKTLCTAVRCNIMAVCLPANMCGGNNS